MSRLPRNVVLAGDARRRLRQLPAASVDCVITSPPYFQLRDYARESAQLGIESNIEDYVAGLRTVCREIARVLKPSGALWLNLRDVYSRTGSAGARPKSLLLGPERLLLALVDDGWLIRNRLVWWKRNSIPESVRDRLSMTHEDVFLLTRGRDYYFDLDAIRVPHTSRARRKPGRPSADSPYARGHRGILRMQAEGRVGHRHGKNPGSVWHYPTSSFRGAHFATFPEALIERPILSTCPERLCGICDKPWVADYERRAEDLRRTSYLPACQCAAASIPGLVLDPFFGSGTVGAVASRLGRDWLGIELSRAYREIANRRIQGLGGPKPHQITEQCGTLNNTSTNAAAQKEDADGQ
jgi:site-specific DNA-methyltransferase (adenine-specific)